jgi:hypothetical protein
MPWRRRRQRALDAEQWPESAQVQAGDRYPYRRPMRADDRYVGLDVHVAAASARPHATVRWSSPGGRDVTLDSGSASVPLLGDHRLKHVPTTDALPARRAWTSRRLPHSALGGSTLPALHHRLVGRRDDIAATQALLARPDIRLVTIAGPMGRANRLALEAASKPPSTGRFTSSNGSDLRRHARPCRDREHRRRQGVTGNVAHGTLAEALETGRCSCSTTWSTCPARLPTSSPCSTGLDLDILTTSHLRGSGQHVVPLLTDRGRHDPVLRLAAARGAARRRIARDRRGVCGGSTAFLAIELVLPGSCCSARAAPVRAGRRLLAMEAPPTSRSVSGRCARRSAGATLLTNGQRQLHDQLAVFAGGARSDAVAVAESAAGFSTT